ncbi:MAG: hypothetical protein IPL46_26255 [Saprospiraceae bacterium]|nr:hypothetical protein [Saprospiraceae bacterium]
MDKSDETSAIRKFEPLIEKLNFFELSILNRMVVNRMNLIHKAEALIGMSKIQVGDRVSWQSENGEVKSGVVFRMNQKTVSVKVGERGHWNVSPQLLTVEK